jgi:hypothetical protein
VPPVEPVRNGAELMACGDRLLLSPHMVAANAGGTLLAAVPWATQAACDALEGRVPQRLVNPEVSRTWLKRFGGKPLLQTRMPAL